MRRTVKRWITLRKIRKDARGRIHHPTRRELERQMRTLHKKLQRRDTELTTSYSIEKDKGDGFHIHLAVTYTCETNLFDVLHRFIGGNGEWKRAVRRLTPIWECVGKWGTVTIGRECIKSERHYHSYLNKFNSSNSKTLV